MDLFKFSTLVIGSVHIVDCGLDPLWGLSTLWTSLNFRLSSLGPSTLWIVVLTLCEVRPLCGLVFVHFVDLLKFSTFVIGSVHIVDCSLDRL